MATGKPVLLVASGEPADIVAQHHVGLVVTPGDIDGLARSLETFASQPELRDELGRNGRRAAESFYNRETIVEQFVQHLEAALA
jgi:glycosyltransferase involved in cell wall biosynthesis